MKRLIIFILTFLLCFIGLFINKNLQAKITGPCSNCHTMHNSQNGEPMAYNNSTTPYRALTRGDCVACHTGTNPNDENIPKVYSTSQPSYTFGDASNRATLAGGNFYWVTTDDTTGHNVKGIANVDSDLGTVPPGYNSSYAEDADRPATWNSTYQLSCAGAYGCHGDPSKGTDDFAAISGAHHKNVDCNGTNCDGSYVYSSYRFLLGVKGFEDTPSTTGSSFGWELNPDTTHHNGYYAVDDPNDSDTDYNHGSINWLCAECHGNFHGSNAGSGCSPWLRHPTDYDMNNVATKEYGNYPNIALFNGTMGVSAVHDYFADVPVGNTAGTLKSTVLSSAGDAIVLCLSCHRAHGSPYADLLRWDYSACTAGSQNANCGCFACHTNK
ncbi:cytochrome c3 family protein [Thermodesulfobacterium hydrogeniphilum]|uniref:cytochrome c3 family protein n=1 Tax=Thermodesulfobacterium hydrogeniphilum TaxID=161156 RepID=UPI00056FA88F|nr:cytochrome c3 family protein [Thermodesulfobacterium hydrogeniphilum]